jgi:hypothetical protein
LARWNGVAWSPVGLGFAHGLGIDAGVGDLAVFDDGSGPALYALGYYVLPIGIAVSRLERWDGSRWTWVPISPEVAGPMAVFSSGLGAPRLYFGARGTVDGLVSFDGSGWQTHPGVLAGVNGGEPAFSSLVAFNDGSGPVLCVGGRFDITGVPGGLGTNVACFDGTSWRSLGGGPSGAVEAMAVGRVGGDVGLFLGGAFESASGAPATGLAAWTGCPSLVGLTLSQQQIPPFGVFLQNTNLTPGREYFNIVSLEPCASGPGTGPYGGLCFTNPSFLIAQLTLPLPAPPFHFQALEETHTFGPFTGLGPLTLEVLSFDITGGVLGSVSGVRQLTVQ